jgi:glycosyltransferase involved in cell wall biosynthesis
MALRGPLSVLMPVRNGQQTLNAALRDLLVAMDPEDELLIVDDGSLDGTPALLRNASASDSRVRVLRTDGVGLVGALNLGMRESRYRWIARADADDRYPVDRLRRQRAAVSPGVVLVTGDYQLSSGSVGLGEIPCALTAPFVVASLIHPQRVPHPGVLLDRDAVQAAGAYRASDFPAEDLALWLRLAHEGAFVGVPDRVLDWTMGKSSVTHTRQAAQRRKTSELLRTIFPAEIVRSLSSGDVERELEALAGHRQEPTRRVLLYRDLRSLESLGVDKHLSLRVGRTLVRSPWRTLEAGTKLVRDRRRRERLRTSFAT